MLIDDHGRGSDEGWGDDETVTEWKSECGEIVIRRQPGTEYRDGEFKRLNQFGLFYRHQLVCDGTFAYVTNYYWREFD